MTVQASNFVVRKVLALGVWRLLLPETAATTAAKRPQWLEGKKSPGVGGWDVRAWGWQFDACARAPKPMVPAVISVSHRASLEGEGGGGRKEGEENAWKIAGIMDIARERI